MLATKSCAEIELRMGRGGVSPDLSIMASAPELSPCRAVSGAPGMDSINENPNGARPSLLFPGAVWIAFKHKIDRSAICLDDFSVQFAANGPSKRRIG